MPHVALELASRAVLALGTSLLLVACSNSTGADDDEAPAVESTAVCAAASPTPAQVTVVDVPPPGRLYHGVYTAGPAQTGEEDDMTPEDVRSYEEVAGKSAAWVYFSHNWFRDRRFPRATVQWIHDSGSVPFIRLMMRSTAEENRRERTFTLQRIIAGEFDGDLCAWAQAARDFGEPLLAEFGTEVNGEWFPWNGVWNGGGQTDGYGDDGLADGPERFRAAYRHIIDLARSGGAHNILWVFHVNNEDFPEEDWNRFESYYPGDDWIDWVGVSVYGTAEPDDDQWPAFRASLDAVYPRLAALSDKPIAVLEFGATAGHATGDQAEWARAALSDLTGLRWPRVMGFSWWNESWENDDHPAHDTEMRIQRNPDLARAFQDLVGESPSVLGRARYVTRAPSAAH